MNYIELAMDHINKSIMKPTISRRLYSALLRRKERWLTITSVLLTISFVLLMFSIVGLMFYTMIEGKSWSSDSVGMVTAFIVVGVITLFVYDAGFNWFLGYSNGAHLKGLPEKLLSDYKCRGLYKPWDPDEKLTKLFDFKIQHRTRSKNKNIFKNEFIIVSGENMLQSRLCIRDVLNIWGDFERNKKVLCSVSANSTSSLSKFNFVFVIRVRKNESNEIHNLSIFILKKIFDSLKRLEGEYPKSVLSTKCLVILDLNRDTIPSLSKSHCQTLKKFNLTVAIFVHKSQIVGHKFDIPTLSCSEFLSQCGDVTTLKMTRKNEMSWTNIMNEPKKYLRIKMSGISWINMLNETTTFMMKNISEEVVNFLCLKSFQYKRATKIFDISFKDIQLETVPEINLCSFKERKEAKNTELRNIELTNCDSSIMVFHTADNVLYKGGYYLDKTIINNCMRSFPRCTNLKKVVFSDVEIGLKQIDISFTRDEINKLMKCTKTNEMILEILMTSVNDSEQFSKKDFDIEKQRNNRIGETIILNQICHSLVETEPNIVEAFATEKENGKVSIVCLISDPLKTYSLEKSGNFEVEVKPYYPPSKYSLSAENSTESDDETVRESFYKHFVLFNQMVAYHTKELVRQHSNLEAVKISTVRITGDMHVEPCLCIVLYCRCKSFIPYGEHPFPTHLKHPREDITFPTDVREGYFIPCTNGNVMTGFAKAWHDQLAMGCSIGPENQHSSATCGPFVEIKETRETCFLTVRHLFEPLTKPDQQIIGTKVVQPAEGDLSPIQASLNNNQPASGNNNPNRRCGEVIASVISDTIDATLIKIVDRLPTRGNYVNVTKDDLYIAGFSEEKFPTYDDGSTVDARILTVSNGAADRVIKFGKETGLRKGTLRLYSMAVKVAECTASVQLNGRPHSLTFINQLQVDSCASNTFLQRGDSGSAVFLVDKDNKLHCIGMAIGVMSDLTTIVTPIQNILHGLGRQLGKTLEIKKFEFEQMDED